jgi:predicted phosphodiesterase
MAPFQGQLGPRILDAVAERAKMREPRVIAIGDVHGCIDELQELLRRCDYRPGDLVLFLGDLVCKGPDSLAVVQLAREIGAIGVRGNHDFEVVRWHQAILAGVDQPVFGSEHFHIVSLRCFTVILLTCFWLIRQRV